MNKEMNSKSKKETKPDNILIKINTENSYTNS